MIKIFFNYLIKITIYLKKRIRGEFYKLFVIRKAGKNLLIGENVSILNGTSLTIGDNCSIENNCYIDAASKKGVNIGNNVTLNTNCFLNCFGKRGGEGISIGDCVTIGNNCVIYGHALVDIGRFCAIGPNVVIVPENHNYKERNRPIRFQGTVREAIKIEEDVWLGAGVKVLAGVNIGRGAVVGAGSIVTKKVPNYTVSVGVPSKVIAKRI